MATSFTLSALGRNQSKIQAQTVSTPTASAVEIVTLNHGLGRTPDKVRCILRCMRTVISVGVRQNAAFLSANASIALVAISTSQLGGLAEGDWDFECEVVHTVVR